MIRQVGLTLVRGPLRKWWNLKSGSWAGTREFFIRLADDFVRRESDQREDGLRRTAFHPEKSDRLKYTLREKTELPLAKPLGLRDIHTGLLRVLSRVAAFGLITLLAGGGLCSVGGCRRETPSMAADMPPQTPPKRSTASASPADLSESFRTAAENVLPAVVQIVARETAPTDKWSRHGHASVPFGVDDKAVADESSSSLLGCGVIVDAAGTVLTNHHVVESAGAMSVQTADGRRLDVRRVASDAHSDLAVLELERQPAEPLPAARLADSRAMRIGDWVLTIGSPLDLGPTVSAGIISATDRIPNGAGQVPLLQTDAAINPGSSGGALVNLAGELIGITTAIASRDGGFQGIGFAIPAETAEWVTSQLREHGEVRWPHAETSQRRPEETAAPTSGETPESDPDAVVYSVELQLAAVGLNAARGPDSGSEPSRGVRIVRIDPDGPAFHAGLRQGMTILRVGEQVIENPDDFAEALENGSIQDGIVLGVPELDGSRKIRVAAP